VALHFVETRTIFFSCVVLPISVENLTKSYSSGNEMDQEETIPVCLTSMSGKQGVGAGPRTNLNIGMDYWNGDTPSVLVNGRGHRAPSATPVIPGVSGNLWPQVRIIVPSLK
jgi:hypothetical protein